MTHGIQVATKVKVTRSTRLTNLYDGADAADADADADAVSDADAYGTALSLPGCCLRSGRNQGAGTLVMRSATAGCFQGVRRTNTNRARVFLGCRFTCDSYVCMSCCLFVCFACLFVLLSVCLCLLSCLLARLPVLLPARLLSCLFQRLLAISTHPRLGLTFGCRGRTRGTEPEKAACSYIAFEALDIQDLPSQGW